MRGKWAVLLLIAIACTNDFFPEGLYGYQVERLLSDGSEKVWLKVVNSSDCADSVRLFIEFIEATTADSIRLSTLNPLPNCSGFDTLLIGNANASSIQGGLLFTDSLLFSNGDFWLVNNITSQSLTILLEGNAQSFVAE